MGRVSTSEESPDGVAAGQAGGAEAPAEPSGAAAEGASAGGGSSGASGGRHPAAPTGVDAVLCRARSGLRRLSPTDARRAVAAGALLIDTRTAEQRAEQGDLPGAICIDRTVLEWRLDPGGAFTIPELTRADQIVVVVCRQGYSSSLAAASLRTIGLTRATDMIGGAEGWIAAGLPLSDAPADVRR